MQREKEASKTGPMFLNCKEDGVSIHSSGDFGRASVRSGQGSEEEKMSLIWMLLWKTCCEVSK